MAIDELADLDHICTEEARRVGHQKRQIWRRDERKFEKSTANLPFGQRCTLAITLWRERNQYAR